MSDYSCVTVIYEALVPNLSCAPTTECIQEFMCQTAPRGSLRNDSFSCAATSVLGLTEFWLKESITNMFFPELTMS